MSKKKFTEGLDELFRDMPEFDVVRVTDEATQHAEGARPQKSSGKSFASDLNAMMQQDFEDGISRQERQASAALAGKSKSREAAQTGAYHGLDSLIRRTIDIRELTQDEETGKRRLTVAVDKFKLDQLKAIARQENSYMKDIVTHLIHEYIEEYRRKKGI